MFEDDDDDDEALPFVGGSETSKAAAIEARKNAKGTARRIFERLHEAGDRGMTTDELIEEIEPRGKGVNGVSARIKGLADKGMVKRGPDTRITRANRKADVIRVVPEAVGNFDAYWHREVPKSAEQTALERAVADLIKGLKQIGKQALANSPDLPSLAQAQKLAADLLLSIYVNLPGK